MRLLSPYLLPPESAQRSLYNEELTLAQARGSEYQSLVQPYRALGGGRQRGTQANQSETITHRISEDKDGIADPQVVHQDIHSCTGRRRPTRDRGRFGDAGGTPTSHRARGPFQSGTEAILPGSGARRSIHGPSTSRPWPCLAATRQGLRNSYTVEV